MKKIVILMICVIILSFESNGQKVKLIPVTTSSTKALELYNQAINYLMDVNIQDFSRLINEAITEDPEFFMAHYQLALLATWLNNEETFKTAANSAISSKARLSRGEQLLREALIKSLADKNADLTEYGKKLVAMYPQDMNAYMQLITFQYLNKDNDAVMATINKALELDSRKDFLYNQLAYRYMEKGRFDEAEKCLDKYVELSPGLANPFDSKGDLYMLTKEYDKAYNNFMKANQIDTAFSKGKMLKAKKLAEDMVIIGEVQDIMKNIKKGLNDLDAEVVFRNADSEHFIRFVSNGTVSEDFNATFTGLKELYSNYKNASCVFASEDYRVLSPDMVLFTGNFSEEAAGVKEGALKIKGAMTIIFQKTGGHWNMAYVHQSYFPVQ